MISHRCFAPDYPGGSIVCTCVRGIDHPEDLFDVPIGEEPAGASEARA
jgi:hypothetical protein